MNDSMQPQHGAGAPSPPPPPAAVGWYVKTDSEVVGPFPASELVRQARSGAISATTAIRKGPDGAWVEASHVNGLVFGPPPIPPRAPTALVAPTVERTGDEKLGSAVAAIGSAARRTIRGNALTFPLFIASILALVFAVLWLSSAGKHTPEPQEVVRTVEVPKEVVRTVEVPKEVVRTVEVPKEVVRTVEVPAKLTPEQTLYMEWGQKFYMAKPVLGDDVFQGLGAIHVAVEVNDDVRRAVQADTIKNKFELVLRRHGIRIDPKSAVWVVVDVEGLWQESSGAVLTYTCAIELHEAVKLERNGRISVGVADTWRSESYGYAGRDVAKSALLNATEAKAEEFANKYLAGQN